MKLLTLTFGLVASALIGLSATPVAAQDIVPRLSNGQCPDGYGNIVKPGIRDNRCDKNPETNSIAATGTAIRKANARDRCPIAYFTDGAFCSSVAPNPPTVRLKASGACRAGEVEDWGIYCVSNYGRLERRHAAVATRDWNTIYSSSGGQSPNQPTPPEGAEYSPAYIAIFGRVKMDGTPFAGGAAPTPAAATQANAQTPPNCPAPSQASAAGQALGGLLGGRRGNSQAGSMLGGLLGAAAAGAAKPAGCP